MLNSGIYIITTPSINEKCYIGSSCNIKKRWYEHKRLLNNNKHHSKHLQNAYNKYGSETFIFSVLLYCSKKDLLFYEQRTIDTYNPEYNICKLAISRLGVKSSKETKTKLSVFNKGKILSEDTKIKISVNHSNCWLGKNHSEETKLKISSAAKNISDETRNKMSISQKLRWAKVA